VRYAHGFGDTPVIVVDPRFDGCSRRVAKHGCPVPYEFASCGEFGMKIFETIENGKQYARAGEAHEPAVNALCRFASGYRARIVPEIVEPRVHISVGERIQALPNELIQSPIAGACH
jgi:hypothetical protein